MSPYPFPRDLSEHIPLIVTTNIRVTTLLCRCNNKYLDIIWKLHCYNLFALLQQLCVEIILLQLLNVVTVLLHRIPCICYNIFLKRCNNGVFYCYSYNYKLWTRPSWHPLSSNMMPKCPVTHHLHRHKTQPQPTSYDHFSTRYKPNMLMSSTFQYPNDNSPTSF